MAGTGTQTYTTAADTNAALFTLPTNADGYMMFKSHKANTGIFWVSEKNDVAGVPVTATVDGDDCAIIEPGESVLIRRPGKTISVICTVASQKFTVANAAGRVR